MKITFESRRVRGDLIQLFKITRGADIIAWRSELMRSAPRAHKRQQLRREIVSSCQQRHHFFSNRTANVWNQLPDEVVNAESVDCFKRKLDEFQSANNI